MRIAQAGFTETTSIMLGAIGGESVRAGASWHECGSKLRQRPFYRVTASPHLRCRAQAQAAGTKSWQLVILQCLQCHKHVRLIAEPLMVRAAKGEEVERPPCWSVHSHRVLDAGSLIHEKHDQCRCRMQDDAAGWAVSAGLQTVSAALHALDKLIYPCNVQAYRELAKKHPSFRERYVN